MGRRGFGLDAVGALTPFGVAARRYIYSSATHWYPRASTSDYATATMTLTIPADYGIVASGDPDDGNPPLEAPPDARGTRTFSFVAVQPARYLSCVITRFTGHATPVQEIVLDRAGREPRRGVSYDSLSVAVNEERGTLEDMVEPYLIQLGFLMRTPRGRVATPRAREHLGLEPLSGADELPLTQPED